MLGSASQSAQPTLRRSIRFRRAIRSPSDHLPERRKKLACEFFCRRVDQALAELRQFAADLRIDIIMQDRDLRAFGFETDGRAALGKPGHAAGTFAGNPIAVRRVQIGLCHLAAEGRFDRSDLEDHGGGHFGRRGHFKTLTSGMHFFSTSGSLSAAQTFSFDAGMRWLSFICMIGFLKRSRWWWRAVRAGARR
jgi:hypothetical protein